MNAPYRNARQAIQAEAAEWVLRLDEDQLDRGAKAELLAWLKTSPQHIDEFLRAGAMWRELDELDAEHSIDIAALVANARENVLAFPGDDARKSRTPATARAGTRRYWLAGMAATLVAAVGVAAWVQMQDRVRQYETGVGQQTLVTLDDGSRVHLNTQSALSVRITDRSRELELKQGEALFDVAKDPDRPFRVRSGELLIEAIGTQFNVYRRRDGVQVTVVEGDVKVQSTRPAPSVGAAPAAVMLTAGEEARSDRSGSVARITTPDLEKHTAWREQRLVFRQDSLDDVATEFNRYNQTQIVIDAPLSATRPITATFDAHDPDSFVAFLERDPTLRVTRSGGSIRVRVAGD